MTPEQRRTWIILRDGYDRNKVLKTNDDVIRAIKISRRLNKAIDPLGPYIIKIANRVGNKPQYKPYLFRDDMVAYAVLLMLRSSLKFNPAKSNNPYAYMVTVCHSAFVNYLNKEKKAALLQAELLERARNGQAV